jgi:hypothetical protein
VWVGWSMWMFGFAACASVAASGGDGVLPMDVTAASAPIVVPVGSAVTLEDGTELRVQGVSVESSTEAPDGVARAAANVQVAVGGWPMTLTWYADGKAPAAEDWRGELQLRVVSADAARVSLAVTRWDAPPVGAPATSLRFVQGVPVTIAPGVVATLRRNSHKDALPGGSSPLGVNLDIAIDGRTYPNSVWVDPPARVDWGWLKWQFKLERYEYDQEMTASVSPRTPHPVTIR